MRAAIVARPVAVVRLENAIPRQRLAAAVKCILWRPRRIGHFAALCLPRGDALRSPYLVLRIWIGGRVEAEWRLCRSRVAPMPDLTARRLAGEGLAILLQRGVRHVVRRLRNLALPSAVDVPRLVGPLRLAEDAVRPRAARMRDERTEEVEENGEREDE